MIYSRVTNKTMYSNIINNVMSNNAKLNELQEQIATGKKVTKPSDNSSAALDILNTGTSINKLDQYIKNIDYAKSELDLTANVMYESINIVHRAKELTVQASNETNGSEQLKIINEEIEQLIQTVKDLGNTQFGSKYIFGGMNTGTPPFEDLGNNEVQYNGTPETGNYERLTEISEGVTVKLNAAGDGVFGEFYITSGPPDVENGQGLLKTLGTLSNELQKDPADMSVIRSKIDDLDSDLNNLLNKQAEIGGISNRLDLTKNKIEDNKINLTEFKNDKEGIDFAQAISDMSFQETTLQASLAVGSKAMQSTLLNYM